MLDLLHLQYFFGALVSLVVITNPPSKIPLFVSLTVGMTREQRHQQANWAAIYSFLVMIVSLIAGNMLLAFFGISYSAMRIAGGLVIAMIGYQMLFGGNSPNNAPMVRRNKEDYAFFPIAMPGIAGPGTIAVVIGFSTEIAELTDRTQMITAFFNDGACDRGNEPYCLDYAALERILLGPPRAFGHGRFGQTHGLYPDLHRRTVCGLGHQEFHCLINAVFRTAKKGASDNF